MLELQFGDFELYIYQLNLAYFSPAAHALRATNIGSIKNLFIGKTKHHKKPIR